ncbi:MAG: DUF2336 domain-containing protein [Alphaproteobacteria bacterium]
MVMRWIKRLFKKPKARTALQGGGPGPVPSSPVPAPARAPSSQPLLSSYEAATRALSRNDREARLLLAESAQTAPEMLFYLADDADEAVRSRVAANPATPIQASMRLVDDSAGSVRAELGRKLARLMPDLGRAQAAKLRDDVIAMLETLARDREARVRALLAEELAQWPDAPANLIRTLAFDSDGDVAGPVLEHAALLRDEDLLEIVAASRAKGALAAIARRTDVSEAVSEDIAASLEIPAIAALLANPCARIREETMDKIVDQARTTQALHEPLVMRTDLSVRTIGRIADFVAADLIERLADRSGLDEDTQTRLRTRLRERTAAQALDRCEDGTPMTTVRTRQDIARAHARGRLDVEHVAGYVAEGQRPAVAASLAALAGAPVDTVERILGSASPKAVTALCWHAGLPMRIAVDIQRTIARVPPRDILLARRGTDYPLTDDIMVWHLDFFGIAPAQTARGARTRTPP